MLSSVASIDMNSYDKEPAFIKIFEKLIIRCLHITRCMCKYGHTVLVFWDICVSPCFSLCSPNYADVLSEHLITRYDVQDIQPKGKMSPVLHNTDLEQKKPRRKDTPALHVSPFAAGKRAGAGHLQGMMGTGQEPYHLECHRISLCPGPAICVSQEHSQEEYLLLPLRFAFLGSFPGAGLELGEDQSITHASAELVRSTESIK